MVVRLFFILMVALAVSVPGTAVAMDVMTVADAEVGESLSDLDEAQMVGTVAEAASDDRLSPSGVRESRAPTSPIRSGIFRPPRAAFD